MNQNENYENHQGFLVFKLILGSINKPRKEDLMKSVVRIVEDQANIVRKARKLHEKMDTFENLKLTSELENAQMEDRGLQEKFVNNMRREFMILNQAASFHRKFHNN